LTMVAPAARRRRSITSAYPCAFRSQRLFRAGTPHASAGVERSRQSGRRRSPGPGGHPARREQASAYEPRKAAYPAIHYSCARHAGRTGFSFDFEHWCRRQTRCGIGPKVLLGSEVKPSSSTVTRSSRPVRSRTSTARPRAFEATSSWPRHIRLTSWRRRAGCKTMRTPRSRATSCSHRYNRSHGTPA
jgi:hypothetical protein